MPHDQTRPKAGEGGWRRVEAGEGESRRVKAGEGVYILVKPIQVQTRSDGLCCTDL